MEIVPLDKVVDPIFSTNAHNMIDHLLTFTVVFITIALNLVDDVVIDQTKSTKMVAVKTTKRLVVMSMVSGIVSVSYELGY